MKKPGHLAVIFAVVSLLISCDSSPDKSVNSSKPNIVLIYFDDLGYGDISAYGASDISTPNIDMLAEGGIMFTDAHSSSATCTPSRYAILTGEYPWRNEKARILSGTAPLLIDTAQLTLPGLLKEQGYHTGIVGKWHLGLGDGNVDWNKHISPGPNELGFDYSFIMAATQDRVPTVYIENGNVCNLDPDDPIQVSYESNFPGESTGTDNPELLKLMWDHGHNNSIVNGIPRIGYMKGGESARWVDENMADTFLVRAQNFITDHKEGPFFLYYALQQPHVPRTPHERFVGETSMGSRGDVIVEADWCIGQLINTLENEGVLGNTLIILSSDNGPVINDGYVDYAVEKLGDHNPSGPFRGGKYSLFEAGTRVPFITYWRGRIEPGISDALASQIDIISSLSGMTGSGKRGPDSYNMLDLLLGSDTAGRAELILEAGGRTAFRKGNWVMIPPYPGPPIARNVNIELGNSDVYQLYNLDEDTGQQANLAETNPEKLEEMIEAYENILNSR
ncbi:MAG TPA: arylsulfatase [Bacteroidetes bacterium]|nr:arylsulfatase [Bacteroidota bacterium]